MENKLGEKAEEMAGGADEKGVEEGSNIPFGNIDEEIANNLVRKVDEKTGNTSSQKYRLDVDTTRKLADKVANDMATAFEKVDEEGANNPVEGFKDIAYSIRKTFYGDESRNTGWDAPEEASGAFCIDIGDMLTAYDQHREDLVSQIANFTIDEWKGDDNLSAAGANPFPNPIVVRKLFVGNINSWTSTNELKRLFRRFGKVVDVHISNCIYSQRRKNFGFVTFKYPHDAQRALDSGPHILNRRELKVAAADPQHQPIELANGKIMWKRRDRSGSSTSSAYLATDEGSDERFYCSEPPVKKNTLKEIKFSNSDIDESLFCKRWQSASIMSWSGMKTLDMSDFVNDSHYLPTDDLVCSILQRCGALIHTVDISLKPSCTECPQLCHLNLSGVPVTSKDLGILGKNIGKQLLTLNLESCPGASDRDIGVLFQNCTKLEKVNVSRTKNLYGHCLEKLCENPVLELAINDCNNIQASVLIPSLKRLPKLRSLQMSCCINMTNKDVAMIVEAVPQLKELSMSRFFPFIDSMALSSLHLLSNLVSLDVHLNPVINDDVMAKIACYCIKIKHLNITGCSVNSSDEPSLSNTGVIAALKLPNLESLYMSYLARVTDEVLEVAANHTKLKHLECRGVSSFTDLGCSRVVTLCSQLESFDFSGCDFVSDITVIAAMCAVKQRMNNVTLLLTVGGTCVTENSSYKDVPLLQVSHLNLCVPHLRPDFVDDIFFPQSDDDFFDDNDDLDEFHLLDWDQGAQGYEFSSVEDYFDYEDYDDYELYEEYDDED
uniref:RRM domain-containing protein n=1 Tax=Timema douglasi TaxID=61478 RepID=A0A7R8ZDR7_TIMDO|nr:unnamed protein product [Timema douglasi]